MKQKRRLGFLIHDFANDGKICPIDLSMFRVVQMNNFSYLQWFDMDLLQGQIKEQVNTIPDKEPGFYLPEFEANFEKYWREKQTGIKEKREPL